MNITDCTSDQQRQGDGQYSVRMNGGSTAPPWQTSNAGKMFTIPTQLRENNEIVIKGNMVDGLLDIGLRPDGNQYNIVCQLNVVYPVNGQSHDQIVIRNVQNGNNTTISENVASEYFINSNFEIHFIISSDVIRIFVGESYLDTVQLQHSMDDIRYISVIGEVQELSFVFNKVP